MGKPFRITSLKIENVYEKNDMRLSFALTTLKNDCLVVFEKWK